MVNPRAEHISFKAFVYLQVQQPRAFLYAVFTGQKQRKLSQGRIGFGQKFLYKFPAQVHIADQTDRFPLLHQIFYIGNSPWNGNGAFIFRFQFPLHQGIFLLPGQMVHFSHPLKNFFKMNFPSGVRAKLQCFAVPFPDICLCFLPFLGIIFLEKGRKRQLGGFHSLFYLIENPFRLQHFSGN